MVGPPLGVYGRHCGFTIIFSLEVVVRLLLEIWNCFCGIQGVGKVVISEWKYVCSLSIVL